MTNWPMRILPLILVGCTGAPDDSCSVATERVGACYGEAAASAFAEACTPEVASSALAETCPANDGKADLFDTPILSPPEEQFKYGSIGSDKLGLPLAILRAVPLVCADTLPPGTDPLRPLAAFGLIYEPGKYLPIGFSARRLPIIGMTLTGPTCSVCHTSTVRETSSSPREVYMGAPATRFDVGGWNAFLADCISDPQRFNRRTLNAAFDQLGIHGLERTLAFGSNFLRAFTADIQKRINSVVKDGEWGPGRDDALGLVAAMVLGKEHLPTTPAPVEFPSAWNQLARKGKPLHWDGNIDSAAERNTLIAVGAGAPRNSVPLASIAAIQNYLDHLPAPAYPYEIDDALASAGASIFKERCLSCHGGERTWSIVDLAEIGTDPNRVTSVTQAGIDEINNLSGAGWALGSFTKTNGYVNNLLDGIWLRAPYLHNGSVPTLRDLLKRAEERPTQFYRGNDTFDKVNVGFVSNVPAEGHETFMLFETARAGNGNSGHEYGTDLSKADQDALLEYLKTL